MLPSSRTPQRSPRSVRAAVGTVVLLLGLAGCSGESAPQQPAAEPTAESTPLADYDTADVRPVRGEFCARVTEAAVAAALGGESTADDSWRPGRRLPDSSDIGNEFGCSWTSGSVRASAWVFAPPITADRAADFAREAVGKKCERLEMAPALGRPSVAQHCGGGAELVRFHGLVGDAWVGCEISGLPVSGGDDTARVGEWCVAVLEALRTA
ncbi:hypothetical protein [Nocardioides sp.]|uniref:hypothetical protein n=1 Tax=Nocardioides sp. TaxID=35761 RepID=UPI00286E60A2|nr:hypothetical protein [Nocardioides sp.]